MAKYNHQKPSPETQEEAVRIAKATQRPGQTKEQTKLIAQGIQKGIDQYKKQQKERSRELSRRLKKAGSQPLPAEGDEHAVEEIVIYRQHWLPWVLLVLTWLGWAVYVFISKN